MAYKSNGKLKYPEWQKPLAEAILDFPNRSRKLPEVEAVIRDKLYLLVDSEHLEEQIALSDALATIGALKKKL